MEMLIIAKKLRKRLSVLFLLQRKRLEELNLLRNKPAPSNYYKATANNNDNAMKYDKKRFCIKIMSIACYYLNQPIYDRKRH